MHALALKAWQSEALVDLLESDNGKDDEKLLGHMINEGKVSRHVAEAYLKSYRENPKEGTIGVVVRAVHAARKGRESSDKKNTPPIETEQPNPIKEVTPTPQPEKSTKKDPARGTGIVAAIIALHEQGLSNQEIIAQGYNRSTVYRQVGEHKKRKKEAKA